MSTENSTEILHDWSPLIKVYKNGTVERLIGTEFTPASIDPNTRVQSKDIVISPELNLSARIFLPQSTTSGQKLPLLIFFHGGAFLFGSAFTPQYTAHLNHLVAESNVVAVSVNYRLAPEHPLPIAHEDSWLALKWVASQFDSGNLNSEEWIRDIADPGRVYLGGDSAGANIAHHMGIRSGLEKFERIEICGVLLNCPYFWGKDRIGNEANSKSLVDFGIVDLWHFACPGTSGCDDPLINPAMDLKLSSFGCKKVLVHVAEKDVLRDRGLCYKELLKKSGWDGNIEVVDVEGEDHVFSVMNPISENAKAMFKKVADFLNQ